MYSLAYADDVVLLAEDKDQMRSMMERLEEYIREKSLEVNTKKSKILRFKKGAGRESKRNWRFGERIIEEVKDFRYLGYVFQ